MQRCRMKWAQKSTVHDMEEGHETGVRTWPTAFLIFNLALVYQKKEEWEKVVDCYQQVYNIESKIFGQDHTQVKETLEALNEAKQNLE